MEVWLRLTEDKNVSVSQLVFHGSNNVPNNLWLRVFVKLEGFLSPPPAIHPWVREALSRRIVNPTMFFIRIEGW
jgi:hypothetical protein